MLSPGWRKWILPQTERDVGGMGTSWGNTNCETFGLRG